MQRPGQLSSIVVVIFWIAAFVAVPLWIHSDHAGWDVAIYHNAIRSLQLHGNPYRDAAIPGAIRSFRYIYPPVTLPLLRFIGRLPVSLVVSIYWAAYILCALILVWFGLQTTETRERRVFVFIAPAALFFPGLLQHDSVLSGNIAIILYALVFSAAVLGWRRDRWLWCYLAILLAACFKLPLLTLLAIPLLSARKQLLPSAITAAAAIALFAVQPLLWPSLFADFLHAVELQFTFNRDFGCSPAGLIGNALVDHGISYSPAGTFAYLAYAIPLFAVLCYLSRKFLAAQLALHEWAPVLLVGVIILNPRIMQYDVLPLTVPMAVILWRTLIRFVSRRLTVLLLCTGFVAANVLATQNSSVWKIVEDTLLVSVFAAGCWTLLDESSYVADTVQTADEIFA